MIFIIIRDVYYESQSGLLHDAICYAVLSVSGVCNPWFAVTNFPMTYGNSDTNWSCSSAGPGVAFKSTPPRQRGLQISAGQFADVIGRNFIDKTCGLAPVVFHTVLIREDTLKSGTFLLLST